MSNIEELEKEIQKIKETIEDRKKKANSLKLPEKVKRIAEVLGEHSDWGGGQYHYSEKGLSSTYTYHNQKYVVVDLGYDTTAVFRAELLQNGVGNIYLYIPGEWEKRIDELYTKIPEKRKEHELSRLQNQINDLKEEWQLEGLI